jgi:hypothetical protein
VDANGIEVSETIPASRKLSEKDARAMAKEASKVIVAKGKKVSEWKPAGKPTKETIAAMLGPTGNLRAPTIRVGKIIVVGFNEEAYSEVLG